MQLLVTRLIMATMLGPFFIALIFVLFFMLSFQMISLAQLIFSQNVSWSAVFELTGNLLLTFLPMAVPLAIFFAAVYCMSKLSSESEYIALRSFGISNQRIFIPVMIVSLGLGLALYQLNQNVIPKSKELFVSKVNQLKSQSFISSISSGKFYFNIPNVVVFMDEFDKDSMKMSNVYLQLSSGKNEVDRVQTYIFARQGQIKWDKTSSDLMKLQLKDGNINTFLKGDRLEKVLFESYEYPIFTENRNRNLHNKASAMTGKTLNNFLKLNESQLKDRGAGPSEVMKARLEYWDRLNTPISCFLFAFIGFGLGISHFRAQKKNVTAQGILILMIYFGSYFTLVGLVKKDQLASFYPVLIPTLLLLFIGYYRLKKVNWMG